MRILDGLISAKLGQLKIVDITVNWFEEVLIKFVVVVGMSLEMCGF